MDIIDPALHGLKIDAINAQLEIIHILIGISGTIRSMNSKQIDGVFNSLNKVIKELNNVLEPCKIETGNSQMQEVKKL